jgi:hypothetical protein
VLSDVNPKNFDPFFSTFLQPLSAK